MRDDRRRLDRSVADDQRRIARAAAHGAVVDAEKHRVAAGARGGRGEHLRHELDSLAADAGEEDLPLHCVPRHAAFDENFEMGIRRLHNGFNGLNGFGGFGEEGSDRIPSEIR
jgi:hypothetical protein